MTLHGDREREKQLVDDWFRHIIDARKDERVGFEDLLTIDRPSPFRLAVIAALISKGKDPRSCLPDALELYREAFDMIDYFDNQFELDHVVPQKPEIFGEKFEFKRHEDWDQAREYLKKQGCLLKTAKAFMRNYRELCIAHRMKDQSEEDAVQNYKRNTKKNVITIPKVWLDHLIKIKKAKKSMGGKKSHQTRKRTRAKKRVK